MPDLSRKLKRKLLVFHLFTTFQIQVFLPVTAQEVLQDLKENNDGKLIILEIILDRKLERETLGNTGGYLKCSPDVDFPIASNLSWRQRWVGKYVNTDSQGNNFCGSFSATIYTQPPRRCTACGNAAGIRCTTSNEGLECDLLCRRPSAVKDFDDSELSKLSELDVKAIELDYRESRRTDEHGNRFKYKAKVRDRREAEVGRWAFDVFLVLDQEQN